MSDTQLDEIIERNRRVEADKAWETSWFRIGTLMVIIYIVAIIFMWTIGVERIWVSALVPAIGYLLSTLSLPPLKRWWIRRRYAKSHVQP